MSHLTDSDIDSFLYSRLDGEETGITSLTRCFAPVHEELVISVHPFFGKEVKNCTLTIGFARGEETYELSAFVVLQEVEYAVGHPKVLRFSSLGGYTIALADSKEE